MGLLFSRVVALQLHCERPTKSEAGVKIIPKQISAFQMHRSSRSFHCFLPLDRSFSDAFVYDCILPDNCQERRPTNMTTQQQPARSTLALNTMSPTEENAPSPISFESEVVVGRNWSIEGFAVPRFSSTALKFARARRSTCMYACEDMASAMDSSKCKASDHSGRA